MHGATCIVWANLTPCSLQAGPSVAAGDFPWLDQDYITAGQRGSNCDAFELTVTPLAPPYSLHAAC